MSARRARRRLARTLLAIDFIDRQLRLTVDGHDDLYARRNHLTYQALHEATAAGVPAGIRLDPAKPYWPVVQFETDAGQVSWHVPAHPNAWDGHRAYGKSGRIKDYAAKYGITTPRARARARG